MLILCDMWDFIGLVCNEFRLNRNLQCDHSRYIVSSHDVGAKIMFQCQSALAM